MKISSKGLENIVSKIKEISDALQKMMVENPTMTAQQREKFKELQAELRQYQQWYKAFSDPRAGT